MRILIAEPSRIGRAIVSVMLAGDGHELVCCSSAEEALQKLCSDVEFDVLITAIEFASMSGFELCWEARLQLGPHQPFHVIVLSSSQDEQKLAEALDCGADDFISKPPRKSELLARLRAASRLLTVQRELIKLASFDSLTGLRNRRSFFEELEKCQQLRSPMSVIMLDIDHFKQVNDRHGHDAGDDVLREVSRRMLEVNKNFARLGGEEFALFLQLPLAASGDIAELVREAIARTPFETCAGPLPITASFGVAERNPGASFESVLKEADVALYAAKSGGRNRVILSRSISEAELTHLNVA